MNRHRYLSPLAPVALLLALAGCVSTRYDPPQPSLPVGTDLTLEAPFDVTWGALIDHASKTFFAIEHVEKASGLLTLRFGTTNPEGFVDCGRWKVSAPLGSQEGPYISSSPDRRLDAWMNVLVQAVDSTHTRVRVNTRYVFTGSGRDWSFDTGGASTAWVSELGCDVTCRPTHLAERDFVGALAGLIR